MKLKMKITPLGKNVLVKPIQSDEKRESGLVLPDSEKKETLTGEVIAVGKNTDETLNEGDKVTYAKYSGNEIGEYLLISEEDILGVVQDE
jgi:chaperonin GroES